VLYNYITNNKQKEDFIKLNNIIFKENKIKIENINYKVISIRSAIGFIYKENIIYRKTIYTAFNKEISEEMKQKFIFKNFKIKINTENLKDYAIDYYIKENLKEIKLYYQKNKFKDKIRNPELNDILKNKNYVKVIKIRDNKIFKTKFEFTFEIFTKKEKKILEKYKIFSKNKTIFSIYINNEEITKKVIY